MKALDRFRELLIGIFTLSRLSFKKRTIAITSGLIICNLFFGLITYLSFEKGKSELGQLVVDSDIWSTIYNINQNGERMTKYLSLATAQRDDFDEYEIAIDLFSQHLNAFSENMDAFIKLKSAVSNAENLSEISDYYDKLLSLSNNIIDEYESLEQTDLSNIRSEINTYLSSTHTNLDKVQNELKQNTMIAKQSIEDKQKNRNRLSFIMLAVVLLAFAIGFIGIMNAKSIDHEVNKILNHLLKVINKVTDSSESMDSSSQSLASSVAQQAGALQEAAATMEQMSTMISRTTENAQRALDNARIVSLESNKGMNSVENLITSMDEIKGSTEKLEEVNTLISVIAKKTKLINEIVFKTQILSFNASIEAASAGEHGLGFSAVAEEVAKLAELSGKSADEINELLDSSVKKVGEIINFTKNKVINANEVTKDSTRVFNEVNEKIASLTEKVTEITVASQEQRSGIEQTKIAMRQITESNDKNSELAKNSADDSNRLNEEIINLNTNVNILEKTFFKKSGRRLTLGRSEM